MPIEVKPKPTGIAPVKPKLPPVDPEASAKTIARILMAEAVSDGPEGMEMVGDIAHNRATRRKKPLDQILTESKLNEKGVRVYQFTGAGRKDMDSFIAKQPPMLYNLALEIAKERMNPAHENKYPGIENYVTQDLYDNRFKPDVSEWVRTYQPAGRVGSHVLLVPPKKAKK